MNRLLKLNKKSIQNYINLLNNVRLSFMLHRYTTNIHLPYIFLIVVDLTVFVITIITMFHYSFYADKFTAGRRSETMIKHANQFSKQVLQGGFRLEYLKNLLFILTAIFHFSYNITQVVTFYTINHLVLLFIVFGLFNARK